MPETYQQNVLTDNQDVELPEKIQEVQLNLIFR